MKKILIYFLLVLFLIGSSFGVTYHKSYDVDYFFKYDKPNNKKFSYNYREANKDTENYIFEQRELDLNSPTAFNFYNNYESGFKIGVGYSKPVTKVYDSSFGQVNMWRRD